MGQPDMQSSADVVALAEERQKRSEQEATLSTAGGMLQAAREAMSLTIAEVATRTNIKERHLAAIEAMDIASLPSQPYTMGFVRAFAREVNLPEEALMERFRQQAGYEVRERAPGVKAVRRAGDSEGGRELSVLALLAIFGFVLWCAWKLLISAAPEQTSEASRFSFSAEDTAEAVTFSAPPSEVNAEPLATDESGTTETEALAADGNGAELEAGAGLAETETGTGSTEPEAVTEGESAVAAPAESAAPTDAGAAPAAAEEVAEVTRLRLLVGTEPVYPPLCEGQAEPIESVTVTFGVNGRGRTTNPRITNSTNPCFNGAALAALSRWRYDPDTVTAENSRVQTARFTFDRPY